MSEPAASRPCPLCGEKIDLADGESLPGVCPHCDGDLARERAKPAPSEASDGGGLSAVFGAVAVDMGYLTSDQWKEASAASVEARRKGTGEKLADILVARGFMTRPQCIEVRNRLREIGAHVRIGPYRVLGKLGQGGMGAVYRAESPERGVVALKILPREMAGSQEFLARFRRESALVKQIDNPHVVRFYDDGEDRGNHYIAMEFVDGESVAERMARRGLISEMRTLRIARDVADALRTASGLGIVHRDIKPANILLTRDGTAKLADLGLSKQPGAEFEQSLTQMGIRVGTPAYMSPEQCLGARDLDARSDIYSLGATLYRMVTGRPPFVAENQVQVLHKHLHEDPVPPIEVSPRITRRMNRLILRMLEKSPDDRFASADELHAYLDRLIRRREDRLQELKAARQAAAAAREELERTLNKAESLANEPTPVRPMPTIRPRPSPPPPSPAGVAAGPEESSDEVSRISEDDTDTGELAALGDEEAMSADAIIAAARSIPDQGPTRRPAARPGGAPSPWTRRRVALIIAAAAAVSLLCLLAIYLMTR